MEGLALAGIGFLGAFVSGLLGIGGAIVLIPLLAYLPPLMGLAPYRMSEIAGMSIVQVFAASLVGVVSHQRRGGFAWKAALPMALATGVTAGLAGLLSGRLTDGAIAVLYAVLSVTAAVMMLLPTPAAASGEALPPDFRVGWAAALSGGVGLISGVIGAGGAFLMAPLMRSVLGMPIRLLIGTSLAVVLAAALMGMLGKAIAGQIPWNLAAFLVVGAVAGSPLGARLSHLVPGHVLRWLLAGAIALAAVKMVLELVA